jgi:hypothetical protein
MNGGGGGGVSNQEQSKVSSTFTMLPCETPTLEPAIPGLPD